MGTIDAMVPITNSGLIRTGSRLIEWPRPRILDEPGSLS